jgi:glycine/D-amino acid oxidase-like deaminating enzyme
MKMDSIREPVVPTDPSWWFQEALAAEKDVAACPPLDGQKEVDVAIVGGGFAGLWTACVLKDRDPRLTIALIEAATCGSGASSKNGGMASGYESWVGTLAEQFGADAALAMVRAGRRAQDMIRTFAQECGTDLWWNDSGVVRISTHPLQDAKIDKWIKDAAQFGLADTVQRLSPEEVQAHCRSGLFRGGAFFPEASNVQPGRLARALRGAALGKGVAIYEETPMTALDRGQPARVRTPRGALVARDVVLAMNTGLTTLAEARRHISMFSSYVVMTAPATKALERAGWTGREAIVDLRQFGRYARTTPGGNTLGGWTGGPIGYRDDYRSPILREDRTNGERAARGLRELVPDLAGVELEKAWGGGVDVSPDRLPFFRTLPGTRIRYAGGFSGHGVNAACIAGQCLASLVLEQRDEWTALPLCTREVPTFPPEPFRVLGARAIRWGFITCEEARQAGRREPLLARVLAAVPSAIGMRLGTR